jgi:hypothetical protein
MLAVCTALEPEEASMSCTPHDSAALHSPPLKLSRAKCRPTMEDEQAVSTLAHAPEGDKERIHIILEKRVFFFFEF